MLSWTNKTSSSENYYPRPNIPLRFWLVPFILVLGLAIGVIVGRSWVYSLGFCVLCLLLLWPIEAGLGIYAFFLPFEPISMVGDQSNGLSITWLLGIMAGVAVLGTMVVRGRFQKPPKAALWWSLLVLWGTLTAVWAIDPALTFRRLPTVLSLFLLFLICVSTRFTERELRILALLSIIGGCASAIYLLFMSGGTSGGAAAIRSSLSLGQKEADPNDFAESLLLPLGLALGGFLLLRSRLARLLMLAALALIGYAVLLTMSRGALLALLVMTFIYLRYGPRGSGRRLLVPVLLLALSMAIMWHAISPRLAEAISTGGAGRLDIWIAGFHAIKEHGVLGAGLDNFPLAYSEVAGYAPAFRGMARASHNIFLGVWVELGVPGLLLLIAAMVRPLKLARQALRTRVDRFTAPVLICHATCWSVLTGGLFLDILWRKTFWLSWMLLTLVLNLRQQSEQSV